MGLKRPAIPAGKKWASGTATPVSGTLSIRGLDFTPSTILVKATSSAYNASQELSVWTSLANMADTPSGIALQNGTSTLGTLSQPTLYADGFDIKAYSQVSDWLAYE